MLPLGIRGQVRTEAHADHAAAELGQAAHDDDLGVAERAEAGGQGKGHGQAVGEANDDVAHDGVVLTHVLLDVRALRGRLARRHAVDRLGAQERVGSALLLLGRVEALVEEGGLVGGDGESHDCGGL